MWEVWHPSPKHRYILINKDKKVSIPMLSKKDAEYLRDLLNGQIK